MWVTYGKKKRNREWRKNRERAKHVDFIPSCGREGIDRGWEWRKRGEGKKNEGKNILFRHSDGHTLGIDCRHVPQYKSLSQLSHLTLTCPRQFLLLAQGGLFVPECIIKPASSSVIKSPVCHLRQGVVPFSHNNSACPQCLREQCALILKALKSYLVDHLLQG